MQNFKLVLCYDGSRYRGWQKQGNTENTIQGRMEKILSRLFARDIELAGSGRTDAGVHARRQVCSFRADTDRHGKDLCVPDLEQSGAQCVPAALYAAASRAA